MKVTAIVVMLFMLFVLPAFTQKPPAQPPAPAAPAAPEKDDLNAVHLTDIEKLDISQALSNLKTVTIDAYQSKIHLEEDNQKIGAQSNEINKKLDDLRKKYNLPKETFFNQDKLYFVKPPAVAPEKK